MTTGMDDAEVTPTSIRAFVKDLVAHDRRLFAISLALAILGTLTESLGLLLLVPLVVAAGVVDGADSSLTDGVASVLDNFGIPFTLSWMLVVYVALIAVRAVVGWAGRIYTARLRYQFVDALRTRLFDSVARASWSFHLQRRSSDISHSITNDVNRVQSGTFLVLDGIARIIGAIGYLAVAIRLSVPTSLLAIGLLALLGGALWPTVRRARRAGVAQTFFGRRNFAAQDEFLDALKLAKSHGNEQRHVEAYDAAVGEQRGTMLDFERIAARSAAALQVGVAASLAVITWFAVERFDTPRAELLALIAVMARLAPVVSNMLSRLQSAANMLPAYANAQQLIADAQAAIETVAPTVAGDPDPFSSVDLEGVSFGYRSDRLAIADVSISIPAGRVVALVGPSGAGKTTLGDLVLGLIEPSDGAVGVSGVPLAELGLERWRARLAYVPQETFLFHDTLRANILWAADETLSDAELRQIVEATALTPVVDALPAGLDTVVGDRGHRLSGGERQRVALARALARRPDLLVLDEATSALDSENEQLVREAIDRLHGRVAMLVIAHRLSTVRSADEIVVLDAGRVVERGTWDELVAAGGRFCELLREHTPTGP